MDPASLSLLIPIVAIVCGTIIKLSTRPRENGASLPDELAHRLEALESEVYKVRQKLGETQERLDVTERLMVHDKGVNRLSPGP